MENRTTAEMGQRPANSIKCSCRGSLGFKGKVIVCRPGTCSHGGFSQKDKDMNALQGKFLQNSPSTASILKPLWGVWRSKIPKAGKVATRPVKRAL
ncbi:hypothetical protein BGX38DRAFT_647979 [Terfezia claveryi]|nr:hypothetical protein BGX38DRAFT_647979 [Terfezia claveryi]